MDWPPLLVIETVPVTGFFQGNLVIHDFLFLVNLLAFHRPLEMDDFPLFFDTKLKAVISCAQPDAIENGAVA